MFDKIPLRLYSSLALFFSFQSCIISSVNNINSHVAVHFHDNMFLNESKRGMSYGESENLDTWEGCGYVGMWVYHLLVSSEKLSCFSL